MTAMVSMRSAGGDAMSRVGLDVYWRRKYIEENGRVGNAQQRPQVSPDQAMSQPIY